jgi:hypothetical protein
MKEFCQHHGDVVTTSGPAGDKDFLTCHSPREDVGEKRNQKGMDQKVKVCGRIPFNADGCAGYCPFATAKTVEVPAEGA